MPVALIVALLPSIEAAAQDVPEASRSEHAPALLDSDATNGAQVKKPKKAKKPKKKRVKVSGYLQVFYRYAFETGEDGVVDNDHFRVLRARVKVKGKIAKKVRFVVEVDPRAPEITGIMRDAYLSFRHIPRHEVRVGQQKTLFGYENTVSSTRLYAVNRSEYADALARGKNLRDVGIGIVGSWPLTETLRLEDSFNLVNGNGLGTQEDDTDRMSVWARVGLRYRSGGLRIWGGASVGRGDFIEPADPTTTPPEASFRIRFKRVGVDFRVDHPFFFASAEGAYGIDEELGEENDVYGGYVNIIGKTPWNLGPIARADIFLDEHQRYTLGAYYGAPRARLRYMINYELRQKFNDERGDDKLYFWVQGKF